MPTVTLSVPEDLKNAMDRSKMINWSEVARRAFVEQLKDLMELQKMKKIRDLSEINAFDDRDFNESYKKELMRVVRGPHTRAMKAEELNSWFESL